MRIRSGRRMPSGFIWSWSLRRRTRVSVGVTARRRKHTALVRNMSRRSLLNTRSGRGWSQALHMVYFTSTAMVSGMLQVRGGSNVGILRSY